MSSVCAYFYNPGLVPFLSQDGQVLNALITTYMIGTTLGALLTSIVRL